MLELSFGEIDGALSLIHSVSAAGRTAFQARLKNLRRLGFPKPEKSGRGRAASFSADELLMFALAIELIQLGWTPERCVGILSSHRKNILFAVYYDRFIPSGPRRARQVRQILKDPGETNALQMSREVVDNLKKMIPRTTGSMDRSTFIGCNPSALSSVESTSEVYFSDVFFSSGIDYLLERLTENKFLRRWAIINFSSLLNLLNDAVIILGHKGGIVDDLDNWSGALWFNMRNDLEAKLQLSFKGRVILDNLRKIDEEAMNVDPKA